MSAFLLLATKLWLGNVLKACVKNSVHSVEGHAWQEGVCFRGLHDGGMHGTRGHVWEGDGCVWQRACMAGGYVWQGACMTGGQGWQGVMCGRGTCVAGETAIAVDGMQPTGMHSCLKSFRKGKIHAMEFQSCKMRKCFFFRHHNPN